MPAQSLTLSQTQRLQMVLAPQLRQSLEMLQVPALELRAMIQKELEMNPTLEDPTIENEHIEIEPEQAKDKEPGTDNDSSGDEMDFDKEFEVLAQLDDEWRDYFYQDLDNTPYNPELERKHQFLMDSLPQTESLQEHLLDQLHLAELTNQEVQVGELIIGSINDDGYLATSIQELADTTPYDEGIFARLLQTVQEFHPTGVGARDLRECLLLQLGRQGLAGSLAATIIRDHIQLLAEHKIPQLAKSLKCSIEELNAATARIATLDPKPGRVFSNDVAAYVLPEVIVKKVEGEYVIILNDDQIPDLRISRHYRRLMENPDTKREVKDYIRDRLRASTFLIRSIDQRQKTIYRIASEIVRVQTPFLDNGITHLRPLTMSEVAEAVGVHETTVSRAVSGKYMRTPNGTFEMKYFFTPGLKTADGDAISNETVKEMIRDMVAEESPKKPLSDQAIMDNLKKEGIKVARRTVAKYRDLLNIPPSHMRRIR